VLVGHGPHCWVREERLAQLLDGHGRTVLAEQQPEGGVVVGGADAAPIRGLRRSVSSGA